MAQWLDEFDQLMWETNSISVLELSIRRFLELHEHRRYYSSAALKRHVQMRADHALHQKVALGKIRTRLLEDTHVSAVVANFVNHMSSIAFRYEWALLVIARENG